VFQISVLGRSRPTLFYSVDHAFSLTLFNSVGSDPALLLLPITGLHLLLPKKQHRIPPKAPFAHFVQLLWETVRSCPRRATRFHVSAAPSASRNAQRRRPEACWRHDGAGLPPTTTPAFLPRRRRRATARWCCATSTAVSTAMTGAALLRVATWTASRRLGPMPGPQAARTGHNPLR